MTQASANQSKDRTKWSRGLWSRGSVEGGDPGVHAIIYIGDDVEVRVDGPSANGIADLITASRDLYDALQGVVDANDAYDETGEATERAITALADARVALAKARDGEAR